MRQMLACREIHGEIHGCPPKFKAVKFEGEGLPNSAPSSILWRKL